MAGEDDYFILLRFASQAELERWRASPETVELLSRGDTHATAPGQALVQSGLETWFTIPGRPSPQLPPPRWKMALVTGSRCFPRPCCWDSSSPRNCPTW
ncbi:hypothetical protein ACN28S_06650 [Cystobacter fuscus]